MSIQEDNLSNCSSRSVIGMMHHFDIKRYPRERGNILYTTLGAIIRVRALLEAEELGGL